MWHHQGVGSVVNDSNLSWTIDWQIIFKSYFDSIFYLLSFTHVFMLEGEAASPAGQQQVNLDVGESDVFMMVDLPQDPHTSQPSTPNSRLDGQLQLIEFLTMKY